MRILIFAVLLLAASGLSAQRMNIVKVNPASLVTGSYNLAYERVINERSSVQLSGRFRNSFLGLDVSVVGGTAGYRYYLTQQQAAPNGFYVNPQLGIWRGDTNIGIQYSTTSFGGNVGYQRLWANNFALDINAGVNITLISGDYQDANLPIRAGTLPLPAINLSLGYAF